jgi:Tfp pilus assembly protein PilO
MKKQTKQWVALTAGVSLVILIAGWFMLIGPQRSKAAGLRADKTSALQNTTQLQTKLAVLKSQAKEIKTQYAELQAAKVKIPTTTDLPGVLRRISAAAITANVALRSVSPTQPTPLAADPSISAVGVTLAITGKYFDTEQFMLNLESLDRAVVVTTLSFSPQGSSDGAVGSSPLVDTNITLDVFTGSVGDSATVSGSASTTSS